VRTDASVDPESISLAFLVLLESLTPLERAVFLLHEVFDYAHGEIAEVLGKDEAACRQLLHRARTSVKLRRPRFAPTREAHERLLQQFLAAVAAGDLAALRGLLSDDARAWSDGGGKAAAARKPIEGPEKIARFFAGIYAKYRDMEDAFAYSFELADVNGWPALITCHLGKPFQVLTIETDGERIVAVRSQLNPEKLTAV
jgi:RNA polymerase sigma-70 factor (ECF subfamily)